MQSMKRYPKILLKVSCLVVVMTAQAQHDPQSDIDNQQKDRRLQSWHDKPLFTPKIDPYRPPSNQATTEQTIVLDEAQLADQPQLILRGLMAALLNHQPDDVAFFLPLYQKLPQNTQEPLILQWSQALIAKHRGDYKQAINSYQQAVTAYPKVPALRLQLATTLFANKQYKQARHHFEQLKENELPDAIGQLVQGYIQAITNQQQWQPYGGLQFLQDKNINNAPKNSDLGGGWTAPKPESATGVGLVAGVNKDWALNDGIYTKTQLEAQTKYYWDNKGYNEVTARLSAGIGYQDARADVSISPFVEQSHYADGNKQGKLSTFSRVKGLSLAGTYWLSPSWQGGIQAQFAKQDYLSRQHLDGNFSSLGASLVYTPKPNRYWFFGGDYHRNNAQAADDSFIRQSIKFGVGQSWQDLSLQFQANHAKKSYRGVGFFGKIQQNQESQLSLSLWHRQIRLLGMTPRLSWQYQKVDSNISLYDYNKSHVFLQMDKRF